MDSKVRKVGIETFPWPHLTFTVPNNSPSREANAARVYPRPQGQVEASEGEGEGQGEHVGAAEQGPAVLHAFNKGDVVFVFDPGRGSEEEHDQDATPGHGDQDGAQLHPGLLIDYLLVLEQEIGDEVSEDS